MIETLKNVPENLAAFRASGEVKEDDFKNTVLPEVKKMVEKTGKLNYLLLLDTDIKNFSAGAWLQDALLGIQNLTKWNRTAIVTDTESIIKFTDAFSIAMPGEFKGFKKSELQQAIDWASETD